MATLNKKIGLLGGSFNPAHAGHLEISLSVVKELGIDEIWWIITSNNPFKNKSHYLPLEERKSIASQIIKDAPIVIKEFESQLNSPYTIDLINHITENSDDKFVWIMGSDNVSEFKDWHKPNEILSSVKVAICNRPDYELNDNNLQDGLGCDTNLIFKGNTADFMESDTTQIIYIKSTNNKISSTSIRKEA
ncbi:MAG: nicotinate (nicotinamide) nucleotide adenylyltransferase [Alphaproteobacteria bacterium]